MSLANRDKADYKGKNVAARIQTCDSMVLINSILSSV